MPVMRGLPLRYQARSVPAWERAAAARGRMAEDSEAAQRLRDLRDKLCGLLEDSDLVDARQILEHIEATELWDEQVVLHSKVRTWGMMHPAYPCMQPALTPARRSSP